MKWILHLSTRLSEDWLSSGKWKWDALTTRNLEVISHNSANTVSQTDKVIARLLQRPLSRQAGVGSGESLHRRRGYWKKYLQKCVRYNTIQMFSCLSYNVRGAYSQHLKSSIVFVAGIQRKLATPASKECTRVFGNFVKMISDKNWVVLFYHACTTVCITSGKQYNLNVIIAFNFSSDFRDVIRWWRCSTHNWSVLLSQEKIRHFRST